MRKKPDAKTYIKAKFLEDTRQIFVLTVQKFVSETGQPYGTGFSFVGEEIGKFCEFLANIQSVDFKTRAKVNITDEELRKIALTTHQAKTFLTENQDLFAEVLKSEVTTEDLIAVGAGGDPRAGRSPVVPGDQLIIEVVQVSVKRKIVQMKRYGRNTLKKILGYLAMGLAICFYQH